jgi:hypothetical protein
VLTPGAPELKPAHLPARPVLSAGQFLSCRATGGGDGAPRVSRWARAGGHGQGYLLPNAAWPSPFLTGRP